MKILMLVHRFPYPPTRGDSLRSWGEVEFLASRHDLWLACVDRTSPSAADLDHVRRQCRDVAVVVRSEAACLARGGLSWLGGRSLTEGYFYDARLAQIVREWDRAVEFGAVLTFSPAMAPYAALVRAARRVLDMNDVESARWRLYAERSRPPLRWLYSLEGRRLARVEPAWVRGQDITLLVNECERAKLPPELRARASVVRTGLDVASYTVQPTENATLAVPHEPVIGFVGSVSYAPNVRAVEWFGTAVWPRIRRIVPEARWLIVGRQPVRRVRRWSQQPGVTVTGFVDDVRPYLARMRVFVCPAREQIGVQTKLIEALAAARPAVVTPAAAAGIDYDDPPPFLVAPSATEFAEAVVRLLRDDAQAQALAARARAVAEANYSAEEQWQKIECWLMGDEPHAARTLPQAAVNDGRAPLLLALAGREEASL
jgi:sugar transferase (PEP-CTERM/EpsH1 system associated)